MLKSQTVIDLGQHDLGFESADQKRIMPSLPHLEIVGRLAAAILIDDIGEGDTADWAEASGTVAQPPPRAMEHIDCERSLYKRRQRVY
jgi:hypothetical protein